MTMTPKIDFPFYFNHLLTLSAFKLAYSFKTQWEPDTGESDDEQWGEILENRKEVHPKISDCLIQLYILHRVYLTSAQLAQFCPSHIPLCPRCMIAPVCLVILYGIAPKYKDFGYRLCSFFMTRWALPSHYTIILVYWVYYLTPIVTSI